MTLPRRRWLILTAWDSKRPELLSWVGTPHGSSDWTASSFSAPARAGMVGEDGGASRKAAKGVGSYAGPMELRRLALVLALEQRAFCSSLRWTAATQTITTATTPIQSSPRSRTPRCLVLRRGPEVTSVR